MEYAAVLAAAGALWWWHARVRPACPYCRASAAYQEPYGSCLTRCSACRGVHPALDV